MPSSMRGKCSATTKRAQHDTGHGGRIVFVTNATANAYRHTQVIERAANKAEKNTTDAGGWLGKGKRHAENTFVKESARSLQFHVSNNTVQARDERVKQTQHLKLRHSEDSGM